MPAWNVQGIRVDIALSVVMEISVLQLNRAENGTECREAIAFNAELWRVAEALAPSAPLPEDRTALAATAKLILAGGRRIDQLSELNRCFARLLAGRAATAGALGQILDRWRAARRAGTQQEFGPWLVDLLDSFTQMGVQSLAA
ncbi:MAG TPA: hypothetical protein VK196_06180 [Magnetospirillum sp.]|nr:hypothetical protein [Magnetospirillum sp.]